MHTIRYGLSGRREFLALPQDLQDFAWSAPMRDLASRVGLSDAGLKKSLKSRGIIIPPQGHWNRVLAGKPVPACPKVPPRGPGQNGRLWVDARFAPVLPEITPVPSIGPFTSPAIPEDLRELYKQELKAIRRVSVPRTLENAHSGLRRILLKEEKRRAKFSATSWSCEAPKFECLLDQRRLRILNALFHALSRRGHFAEACERDEGLSVSALIGDTEIAIEIAPAADWRAGPGRSRPPNSDGPPATTPLRLSVEGSAEDHPRSWIDDASGKLESKLAQIVAATIVAGEARFRRRLAEAEERAEQFHKWRAKRRQGEIEARNRKRLEQLRESGELLRQADDLRALLERVRGAVLAGALDIDAEALTEWQRWAVAEADRLDSILSGQVLSHLVKPDD